MIGRALWLSVVVAGLSALLVAVLGSVTSWLLSRRPFPGRALLEALLSVPLVLPPTVTGYYLLVLLGRKGWLGGPLLHWAGISVPFTWVACVIAASVMAFPLMLQAGRVAFDAIDPRHELVARSLGHGSLTVFLRVHVPLARGGLAVGAMLAFARALGEFGATLMLAGNIPAARRRCRSRSTRR
jgi:molybdate transport system permease protein